MYDVVKTQELFIQTLTAWTEAQQRVLAGLVELGSATAKEGVRLYGELQRTGLDALRQAQGGAQQAFRLAEEQVQAVSRSAERLTTTAEQAGKGIQETLVGTVSKVKDIYAAANGPK